MDMNENLIKITEYEVSAPLPDPFCFDDGTRVKNISDWERRRKEIYKTAVTLQYGTLPPQPEFLNVDTLYKGTPGKSSSYLITTGTHENPVVFTMYVFAPNVKTPFPAVISGDLCFKYAFDKEFIDTFNQNGIALVLFNRTELAHDVKEPREKNGQIYKTYPESDFGSIGAWAWGYSRCVDALEKLGIADMNCITFTGHSRGGKTAALAGAVDSRAAIVNPNETCAGACGCYRLHMKAITEDGDEKRSERLSDLIKNYSFWMGPELAKYAEEEAALPFDCHYLKALVAPRVLFISEAASDIWANPVGSWQTTMAAKEVYKLYGKEENLLWYYRNGYHSQTVGDIAQLVNIIKHYRGEEPLNDQFFKLPFKQPDFMFDWRCPAE